ncbi:SbcC/MukB-like Walker B domain-containing protein [Citrobacter farmeri]|uniref:SbcC/MukB-like Walker B domain-containing protein n=1 Tax=Citrobacter farmeri TaxID=67824 RepID=UPI00388E7570|nr:AAA family ATPase [Citrobacter farmeri]
MSTAVSTHRMVRITLMNWYLFSREDLDVDAASVMISGANGAGKSSIIDAIQTVLSGGNENVLSMNAQSSSNQKSSRNIQTYALGVVDDQEFGGELSACRSESNTYVALTFRRPDGTHYAVGMGFHARSGDNKVNKLWFVTNGHGLSSADFLYGNRVITLSDFQRRLKAMDPTVLLAKNAKNFRLDYCQLMSREGPGLQISPDAMWHAIKNGIAYRGEKSISDFISSYILPDENVDINRLHNDYQEHERILALIEKTEQEIIALNSLLTHYHRYERLMIDQVCYGWVSAEASLQALDLRLEQSDNLHQELGDQLEKLTQRQTEMKSMEERVNRERDEARDLFMNSAATRAIEKHEDNIRQSKERIVGIEQRLLAAKQSLARFLNLICPSGLTVDFRKKYENNHNRLSEIAALSDNPLIPWPAHEQQGAGILSTITVFGSFGDVLSEERDNARSRLAEAENDLKELLMVVKKLESGGTPLATSTETVIRMLKQYEIIAVPVCELSSISDASWQEGIERYLGRNREALVITDGNYTDALKIYRKAIRDDKNHVSLRGVRLVNPDYDFGYQGVPKKGTAASLIKSENTIALKFLYGLLWSVNLVNTEEELRHEKRAITSDGMVAANGSISGGNDIKGIMIGVEARRQYARKMQVQVDEATARFYAQKKEYDPIDSFYKLFQSELSNLNHNCLHIEPTYQSLIAEQKVIREKNLIIEKMRLNVDKSLEEAFRLANHVLDKFNEEKTSIAVTKSDIQKKLDEIENQRPAAEEKIKQVAGKRNELSTHPLFEQERASRHLEKLIALINDERDPEQQSCTIASEIMVNEAVALVAQKRVGSAESSARNAGDNAREGKIEFMARFEPANRDELRDLDPYESRKAFERHLNYLNDTELVIHRHDAEKACSEMLTTFRADVVSTLQDAFQRMRRTFRLLNEQLKDLPFNNNTYRFVFPVVENKTLKDVHDYVVEQSKSDTEAVGTLFDFSQEHPAISVIQDVLTEGRIVELSDYRNFFTYDIMARDLSTGKERRFSNLLSTGSGGEQQSPFYIAFGASFMTAFKVQRRLDQVNAGAVMAIFDEAFSRMDGNNTFAALEFFSQIGLQAFLAAPLDAEVKMGHHVERVVTIIRDGLSVFTDSRQINDAGWELLESDNPKRHPELIEAMLPQARKQLGLQNSILKGSH